jgi:hypothetical protein
MARKATPISNQDQTKTARTLGKGHAAITAKTQEKPKTASLDEAEVTGKTRTQEKPDQVRRKNSQYRDSRSRLGKGKSSTVVID